MLNDCFPIDTLQIMSLLCCKLVQESYHGFINIARKTKYCKQIANRNEIMGQHETVFYAQNEKLDSDRETLS